ncbi:unnamed protein product [Symbiodinium sp. KB8]|nr:unnamed protein product [Symbiodinium sp. KB8]
MPGLLTPLGRPTFDPVPFLDNANRQVYKDPLKFTRPLAPDASLPKVRVHATRANAVRLLEVLDASGRLKLVPASELRPRLRNGVFALAKDEARDRMILDARAPNAVEDTECRWVRSLGTLEQLQFFILPPDCNLETHTEDLREFYHSFIISHQRCLRNSLAIDFAFDQVKHLSCCPAQEAGRLIPCLATMAMGDCNAVAMGQCSHLACILRPTTLQLRDFVCLQQRPPRPGQVAAGLLIDDFILLDPVPKVPRSVAAANSPERPDPAGVSILKQVIAGCEKAGLPRHAGKATSRSLVGEFWGGLLDGVEGKLRRLLCLLEEIYSAQRHLPRDAFVRVRGPVRTTDRRIHINVGEVRAAIFDGACRYVHLQDSQVSLACFVKGRNCSPSINKELRRSLPFHLAFGVRPSFGFIRSRFNPSDDPTREVALRKPEIDPPRWLCEAFEGRFDELDRFLSEHGVRASQLTGLPDEAELQPDGPVDPRCPKAIRANRQSQGPESFAKHLLGLSCLGPSDGLALFRKLPKETPSRESRLHSRSCSFAAGVFVHGGVLGLRSTCSEFPESVRVFAKLIRAVNPELCFSSFTVNQNVETLPHADAHNAAWEPNLVLALRRAPQAMAIDLILLICAVAPSGSSLLLLFLPRGEQVSNRLCSTCSTAFPLAVSSTPLCFPTLPLPSSQVQADNDLLSFLVGLAALASELKLVYLIENPRNSWMWKQAVWGLEDQGDFLVDMCVFGTRWKKATRVRTNGSLRGKRPTLDASPLFLLVPALEMQVGWERADLSTPELLGRLWFYETSAWSSAGAESWSSVRRSPELLVQMLIVFGQFMYDSGGSLQNFRQLLAHAQVEVPGARAIMRPAWDQVTRWERLEPTKHRTPMPEPIMLAMCALALSWNWDAWAAATLFCFYGACRIGEVLKAKGGTFSLLLTYCAKTAAFICVSETRKLGVVDREFQHVAVNLDGALRDFFLRTWSSLRKGDKLFCGSPWMYRKRWDSLLRALGIPVDLKLTPGGLRGGGAVAAYRRGDPVSEIQWRMRLQHLGTLAFYLQEVSALSVIPQLHPKTRSKVSAAASLFPFLVACRPAHIVQRP